MIDGAVDKMTSLRRCPCYIRESPERRRAYEHRICNLEYRGHVEKPHQDARRQGVDREHRFELWAPTAEDAEGSWWLLSCYDFAFER
ncbi:hypothetical protein BDR03DRAFT_952829 [Suillus americanus]|nr:hypothetical protein BDR03DRAFT_952829 [Suillus americanus]